MNAWRPSATSATLRSKARILASIRAFFAQREVMEVHTPLLGSHSVTDPEIDGIAVPGYGYLQTSPEYFMKRLLAAGVGDCYQLASAFRHEEQGRLHNSEFCMLEWYRLDFDGPRLMKEVAALCDEVLGLADYRTCTYASLVGDVHAPREELDLVFADGCAGLQGRCFIVDYPADQAGLARLQPDNPELATRFELVVEGVEIANGYWELLDADEHRQRFAEDLAVRRRRGLSEPVVDERLLAALENGLPACAGVALGVDRLVMLALGLQRLEEVLTFRC